MEIKGHTKVLAYNIEESDLIKNEKCGFCESTEFISLQQYFQKPDIHFVKCKNCGAVTYDKQFSQAALDKMYSNYEYHSEDEVQSVTFYGSERFAKHISKYVDFAEKDKVKILDFGGGDGALAYFTALQLKKRNPKMIIEILVVDYCNSLYKSDRSDGITMRHDFPLSKVEEEFDLIIASAIIEHLPKPAEEVKKLFTLLTGGGYIYFRTPYVYPLWRDLRRFGITYKTLYPQHIWDLGGGWYDGLVSYVKYEKEDIHLILSKPSIVEESFKINFWIALASYVLKAPWYICHKWPYTGGWEAIYKKD